MNVGVTLGSKIIGHQESGPDLGSFQASYPMMHCLPTECLFLNVYLCEGSRTICETGQNGHWPQKASLTELNSLFLSFNKYRAPCLHK